MSGIPDQVPVLTPRVLLHKEMVHAMDVEPQVRPPMHTHPHTHKQSAPSPPHTHSYPTE